MNKETREQIKKEAKLYGKEQFGSSDFFQIQIEEAYLAGATAQHPKAWNAAIEAAKGIIRNDLDIKLGEADRIIENLQALKLDPNQA